MNALLKKEFDKVLDVGCGTGVYYQLLSKRVGQLVGLDISKNMLSSGEKQADSSGLNKVTFVLGDAEDMPFPVYFVLISSITLLTLKQLLVRCLDVAQIPWQLLNQIQKTQQCFSFICYFHLKEESLELFHIW